MRIVSLLPGATETLCRLGLAEQIVGISHECDYPREIRDRPRMTQSVIPAGYSSAEINKMVSALSRENKPLYELNLDELNRASPDLIVTQDLCGVCAVSSDDLREVVAGMQSTPKLISQKADRFDQVLEEMLRLGSVTGRVDAAQHLIDEIRTRIQKVKDRVQQTDSRPRTVLLEWLNPLFSAGHWTPELIHAAGGIEMIGVPNTKSRQISWKDLHDADPERLILACCGRSISETRQELQSEEIMENLQKLSCVQTDHLYLMNGSAYLNRPGPRLIDAVEILSSILHPPIARLSSREGHFVKVSLF